MGEAQEVHLQAMDQGVKEANSPKSCSFPNQSEAALKAKSYKRWVLTSAYIIFLLFGQTGALILGRLYFVKGGNSKWMATLVQLVGFPILIPCYFIATVKKHSENDIHTKPPSISVRASIYISLGLLIAAVCFLFSIGLKYLPVSTYTLLSASQLAFNALFSLFLNSQKFTPFIINSLVLLTISSILLMFNNEDLDPKRVSKVKYAIGFVCTIAASAGNGLLLSLTQLCFKKVFKRLTFKTIIEILIYEQIVAASASVIGLFASGEWNGLSREMDGYEIGKLSYVMTLVWTAISWQVFSVGCFGLVLEVSSLFSNAIIVLGLPIVPVLAVFVFHDKMDGIKAISMVLAIWGFISYTYQYYLDGRNPNAEARKAKDSNNDTPMDE